MATRWTRAVVAVALGGAVLASVELGVAVVVVAVLTGGVIGAWAQVYARCMCAVEPLDLSALVHTAALGALVAPAVLLVERALGPVVWVALVVVALWWVAAVSDGGHIHPLRARRLLGRPPGDGRRP